MISSVWYLQYATEQGTEALREVLYGVQWRPGASRATLLQSIPEDDMQQRLDPFSGPQSLKQGSRFGTSALERWLPFGEQGSHS